MHTRKPRRKQLKWHRFTIFRALRAPSTATAPKKCLPESVFSGRTRKNFFARAGARAVGRSHRCPPRFLVLPSGIYPCVSRHRNESQFFSLLLAEVQSSSTGVGCGVGVVETTHSKLEAIIRTTSVCTASSPTAHPTSRDRPSGQACLWCAGACGSLRRATPRPSGAACIPGKTCG